MIIKKINIKMKKILILLEGLLNKMMFKNSFKLVLEDIKINI